MKPIKTMAEMLEEQKIKEDKRRASLLRQRDRLKDNVELVTKNIDTLSKRS
jgi:NAD-dependent SIR2 family protein deacetylase